MTPVDSSSGSDSSASKGPSTRTRITIAVVILVAVAIAIVVVSKLIVTKKTDPVAFDGSFTSVKISADGDVAVADGGEVTVERSTRYVFRKPSVGTEMKDGVLELRGTCDGLRMGTCAVGYRVTVPPSVPLIIENKSGKVDLNGLKTDVQVKSKDGAVRLDNTYGKVDVVTTGGKVSGEKISSQEVKVETQGGAASVQFAATPSRVDVTSTAGDIDISVPKSSTAYVVDAASQGGKTVIEVGRDAGSPFSIKARSENGDVTVRNK